MKDLLIKDIVRIVEGRTRYDFAETAANCITTDSRKIEKGDLFVALKGENFNGNDYAKQAISKGAVAVIVSEEIEAAENLPIIFTENTLEAYQSIARHHRITMDKPIIAVTGSVGKTSTKDMIAAVLEQSFKVHKTHANHNNEIGMPQTILGIKDEHDVAIVEMGMRGLGEIRTLSKIGMPDIGVITNIGISHIERLKTRENILKAKMEIADGMDENNLLILNANDELLIQAGKNAHTRVEYTGIEVPCTYSAYNIESLGQEGSYFSINHSDKTYRVKINVPGEHHISNALVAIACGTELGMTMEAMMEGIANYTPGDNRQKIININNVKYINDSYNASPDSMKAGLKVLKSIARGRTIAVLGNMFELGDMAEEAHKEVGEMCQELGIDFSLLLGENAKNMAEGIGDSNKYKICHNHLEIAEYLEKNLIPGDTVLIKGSRGMKMEEVLKKITENN